MKLYCLGQSCFVIKFNKTHLLLDCGLEPSLLQFLPYNARENQSEKERERKRAKGGAGEIKKTSSAFQTIGNNVYVKAGIQLQPPEFNLIDLSCIDAVLITNYFNMMALPYLTEYTNFKGKIYATEPTAHIGRLLMQEFVEYNMLGNNKGASDWQRKETLRTLPPGFQEQLSNAIKLRPVYTKQDVENSCAKISGVSFFQEINVFNFLTMIPSSSGYCLGSANWTIKTDYEKIVYMAHTSSSTRHPEPIDPTLLYNPHVLLLTHVNPSPSLSLPPPPSFGPPPSSLEAALSEFSSIVQNTISGGGSVVIPIHSCGVILDLMEYLDSFLVTVGMSYITQYFVSPAAESVLAYADIVAEWLCKSKQDRVYLPDPPFLHTEMMRIGRLVHMPHIYSGLNHSSTTPGVKRGPVKFNNMLKEPCIIFAGHPSCRCGDIVHLIETYGSNPKNSIICVEPEFPSAIALAPFQPLASRVFSVPLDPRLTLSEALLVLTKFKPKHLVLPKSYVDDSANIPSEGTTSFSNLEIITIPLPRQFERGEITKELAQKLKPQSVIGNSQTLVSPVTAQLSTRDRHFTLHTPTLPEMAALAPLTVGTVWGAPNAESVLSALRGIGSVTHEHDGETLQASVQINGQVVRVSVSASETKIDGYEPARGAVQRAVMANCLAFK